MISLARLTHVFGGNPAWAFLLDPLSFGMAGEAQLAQEFALALGIMSRIIRRGDILMQSGGMGDVRRWEFKTLERVRSSCVMHPGRWRIGLK